MQRVDHIHLVVIDISCRPVVALSPISLTWASHHDYGPNSLVYDSVDN